MRFCSMSTFSCLALAVLLATGGSLTILRPATARAGDPPPATPEKPPTATPAPLPAATPTTDATAPAEEPDCDGADLKGETCQSLGFSGGTLGCKPEKEFDFSACFKCGNDIVEPGEDCETKRPITQTCNSTGYPGGTLGCRADCTFDTSGCNRWSQLAVGRHHACGQASDGALWCWGNNGSNQLGTPAGALSTVPVAVARLGTEILAFTAGAEHTCAVKKNGSVWCWGNNTTDGRLGDGSTAPRSGPVKASGLDADVVALTAGDVHTCALRKDGTLWCWGGNGSGQLGDLSVAERHRPVQVTRMGNTVVAVSAGRSHTCALKKDGTVWCWGDNVNGQLGLEPSGAVLSPSQVAGLSGTVVQISSGPGHTCAVKKDRTAWCWGDNATGQLGDQTLETRYKPVKVQLDSNTIRIGAGAFHGCAQDSKGAAWCWGSNAHGQLGDGTDTPSGAPVRVKFPARTQIVSLGVGDRYSCALTQTGAIYCWGDNVYGQIGCGTPLRRELPTLVTGLTSRPASIFAGFAHTCAILTDGTVSCWGDNAFGQLGDGTTTARGIPAKVAGLMGRIAKVAPGRDHTCALAADGAVRCWGKNTEGQLGDPSAQPSKSAQAVAGLEADVAGLCAGLEHACARKLDGSVWCWGDNGEGALGTGDHRNRFNPVQVRLEGEVTAVSCGHHHTCALKKDATTWCWGNNTYGQLGDGTKTNHLSPVRVPLYFPATQLFAGARHTCATKADRSLHCWGFNFYGQLGDGTTEDRTAPVGVLTVGTGVVSMAPAESHACAVKSDGTLWCWGKNDDGRVGDGSTNLRRIPFSLPLPPGLKATAVVAGATHTCALYSDSTLRCWGSGLAGQLGEGTIGRFNQPRSILFR
ncbi:RCC1 repeat-containing protein [Myxococcota bacterium]|nr:RCC1 repeat-containing protein [Myxococcota bacterium]